MMNICVICEKGINPEINEWVLIDAKLRRYHHRCLRAALSEFDKWGIEMMRHFAARTINLTIGALR
jgi:hypothetical protein